MNRFLVMFADPEEHWLLVTDGAIDRRGKGFDSLDPDESATRVYIATADQAIVQWLDLPDLSPAQASAAARVQLDGQSLLPAEDLHLLCSQDGDRGYLVVTVSRAYVSRIIDQYDPDIILPSPLLLPVAETGFAKAVLPGETVIRNATHGFADDQVISPLIIGDAPVAMIEGPALEAALLTAVMQPAINLRSGTLSRRVPWRFDSGWRRKMLIGAALLLLLTVAIPIAEITRLSLATRTVEQTSASLAQAALGEAVAPERAVESLDRRLALLRGGGAGFLKTSGAALRAIESVTNVEVISMTFDQEGTLRLLLRATSADELTTVQNRMRAAGLELRPSSINPSQGQPTLDVQVRGR